MLLEVADHLRPAVSRVSSVRMMFSKSKDLNTSRFVEKPPT